MVPRTIFELCNLIIFANIEKQRKTTRRAINTGIYKKKKLCEKLHKFSANFKLRDKKGTKILQCEKLVVSLWCI